MEPENHTVRKGKSSSKPSILGFHVDFQGCTAGEGDTFKRCLKLVNLIDYFTKKKSGRKKSERASELPHGNF